MLPLVAAEGAWKSLQCVDGCLIRKIKRDNEGTITAPCSTVSPSRCALGLASLVLSVSLIQVLGPTLTAPVHVPGADA